MIGRNIASANTLLRQYARRPGVAALAGGTVGFSRQPLMRFFENQARADAERHRSPQQTPLVQAGERRRVPFDGYQAQYQPSDTSNLFSQRRSTGFDNRPFSEPIREPEMFDYER